MNKQEIQKLQRQLTIESGPARAFLDSLSAGSRPSREGNLKKFAIFLGGPSHIDDTLQTFLQTHIADRGQGVEDTQHYAESVLGKFLQWLKNAGYSAQSQRTGIYTIGAYCAWKHKTLEIDWNRIQGIPPATKVQVKNRKYVWSAQVAGQALQFITNNRDRAIFLMGFQGALRVGDLCNLNFEHIAEEYIGNSIPLKVGPIYTEKTDQECHTFVLADAVHYLRLYEAERGGFQRGEPLFLTKDRKRISKNYIARFMKQLARKLAKENIISGDRLNHASLNPFGFHSFRTSFETNMRDAGMSDVYIDYFMAHEQRTTGGKFYFQPKKARATYKKFAQDLTVNARFAEAASVLVEGMRVLDSLQATQEAQATLITKLTEELHLLRKDLQALKEE